MDKNRMVIVRQSSITGATHRMELPIEPIKYLEWLDKKSKGTAPYIQQFFPELNEGEREFLLSGVTPEEWAQYLGEEE